MSIDQSAAAAEAAAIATQRAPGTRRRKMVMGIDVGPYAGYRVPGLDRTAIFSQPYLMIKGANPNDPGIGMKYMWRKPDDPFTVSMVARGVLRRKGQPSPFFAPGARAPRVLMPDERARLGP